MLRDMWQFIVDALTHARYRVSLQLEQEGLYLRAYRNGVTWPMERVVRDDPLMARFAERFGVVGEAIPVPPPPLENVIKSLLDLPEDNWFEVDIAEELRDLKKTDPPDSFRVDYAWSGTDGEAIQHVSHEARYIGDGWFFSPLGYWFVRHTTNRDDHWLRRRKVSGRELVVLAARRGPSWQKRDVPYNCAIRYRNSPALTVEVREVSEVTVEISTTWRVDTTRVSAISGLEGYVVYNNELIPGVTPDQAFGPVIGRQQVSCIRGDGIPQMLTDVWPVLSRFARGKVAELERMHRIVDGVAELVLSIRSDSSGGIGRALAIPMVQIGKHRLPALPMSEQLAENVQYVRTPSGWAPRSMLETAGLGPDGRAQDGTPLAPLELSPAELLSRGSYRCEGPWKRIEAPSVEPPTERSHIETAQEHLEYLLTWGLPGGVTCGMQTVGVQVRRVLSALVKRSSNLRILVVGKKKLLKRIQPTWSETFRQRFMGYKSDPDFQPDATGITAVASTVLSKTPEIRDANWDLLVLLNADDMVKSSRSGLYDSLTKCKSRLRTAVFKNLEWQESDSKRDAMAHVLRVSNRDADACWRHLVRDPFEPPASLGPAYRLTGKKRSPGQGPAEIDVAAPQSVPSARRGVSLQISQAAGTIAGGKSAALCFVEAARKLASRDVPRAKPVPFQCYWPTYDSMTRDQLKWYFHWRGRVRRGAYPDTDLSYVFVHIYELLHNIGPKDPREAHEQLLCLWRQYRDRHSKLTSYVVDWAADHAVVHGSHSDPLLPYKEAAGEGLLTDNVDLILADYEETPWKMPLIALDLLTDYRIRQSKFYNAGYADLMSDTLSEALKLVDQACRRQRGEGIMQAYAPGKRESLRRVPFQSAVYAEDVRPITIARLVPYSTYPPLREFLTSVVKHTENLLRAQESFRGRLRGIDLSDELAGALERMVEGSAAPIPRSQKVRIDLERVEKITGESDEVREMLMIEQEGEFGEPQVSELKPAGALQFPKRAEAHLARPEGTPEHLLTDLEPVHEVLVRISSDEQQFICQLRDAEWEADANEVSEALEGALIEPMIDHVNALALEHLGDILVATDGDLRIVSDDYRDELEHLLSLETSPVRTPEGVPPEWRELLEGLNDQQAVIVKEIISRDDARPTIHRIADEIGWMPEMLIDSINEISIETIGDRLVVPGSIPPELEPEYESVAQSLFGS